MINLDVEQQNTSIPKNVQIKVTLYECRGMKIKEGVPNPYLVIKVGEYLMKQTQLYKETDEIIFSDAVFDFDIILTDIEIRTLKISIAAWHKTPWYKLSDLLIGSYSIDAYKVLKKSNHIINNVWANLENHSDDGIPLAGYVNFSVMVKGDRDKILALQAKGGDEGNIGEEEENKKKMQIKDFVKGAPPLDTKNYSIILNVFRGEFIDKIPEILELNSYFKIIYSEGDDLRSIAIFNSKTPNWKGEAKIPVRYPYNITYIVIEVWHDDGKGKLLGKALLNFDQLVKDGQLELKWHMIYGPEREQSLMTKLKYFLKFGTMKEYYYYYGRILVAAKYFPDDGGKKSISNNGQSVNPPEEKQYKFWVDVYELLGKEISSSDEIKVEVQLGNVIAKPSGVGKWNDSLSKFQWVGKNIRVEEKQLNLPPDPAQIPDIFIRVYKKKTLFSKKTYLGYQRFKASEFLNKKTDVKAAWVKLRKCETKLDIDSDENYLGLLLCSINFFIVSENVPQLRPILIQTKNFKKYKLISVIYMGKNLPLNGVSLPNSYVSVFFNGCTKKKTTVQKETDCPIWGDVLFVSTYLNDCLDLADNVKVEVHDTSGLTEKTIGKFEVVVSEIKKYSSQNNIEYEIYKNAKWYALKVGMQELPAQILASFFIVKLTKQGKEKIDLSNKKIWPKQERYNLYLFIIGARMTDEDIEACYVEAKYNNESLEIIEENARNKEKFQRVNKDYKTNNLNNFDFLGEKGFIGIDVFDHTEFSKPLSLSIKKTHTNVLYTANVDLKKLTQVSSNQPLLNEEEIKKIEKKRPKEEKKRKKNDDLLPSPEDMIPLYRFDNSLDNQESKTWNDLFIKTMATFPLDPECSNSEIGMEFIVNINNKIYDKNGKLINDDNEKAGYTRSDVDGPYEAELKEDGLDFQIAKLTGNKLGEDEEKDACIRYIIRVEKANDTSRCDKADEEVKTLIRKFKKYSNKVDKNLHGAESSIHFCRIYILNTSNLSIEDKAIKKGYVWIKRYKNDSEYKTDKRPFDISQGEINYAEAIVVDWPETFFLTIELYGLREIPLLQDEHIGSTVVDLERRYFHREYYEKVSDHKKFRQIPIESRTLYKDGVSKGALRMWIEILPKDKHTEFAMEALDSSLVGSYQLRLIIWNTRNTPRVDSGKVDIKVRVMFQGTTKWTDVHNGSKDGNGQFNWRMCINFTFPNENSCIQISVFDHNTVSNDEPIGSNTIDIRKLLNQAHASKSTIDFPRDWLPLVINSKYEKGFSNAGEVELQFKIISQDEAQAFKVGEGQDDPNRDPTLETPKEGRNLLDKFGFLKDIAAGIGGLYDGLFRWVKILGLVITIAIVAYVISIFAKL